MTLTTIDFVVIGIVIAGLLVAWYFGWRKEVLSVLNFFIEKADEVIEHGDNEAKIQYVIDKIKPSIPAFLRLIITTKTLKWLINKVHIQVDRELAKEKGINLAAVAVEKLANEVILAQVNGDSNLCDNKTVIEAKEKVKIDLGITNAEGLLYGAINGTVKLTDNINLKGTVDTKGKAGVNAEFKI